MPPYTTLPLDCTRQCALPTGQEPIGQLLPNLVIILVEKLSNALQQWASANRQFTSECQTHLGCRNEINFISELPVVRNKIIFNFSRLSKTIWHVGEHPSASISWQIVNHMWATSKTVKYTIFCRINQHMWASSSKHSFSGDQDSVVSLKVLNHENNEFQTYNGTYLTCL